MAKKNELKKPKNKLEAAKELTPDVKSCERAGCRENKSENRCK